MPERKKTLVRELVRQLSNNCELVTLLLEWLKLTEKRLTAFKEM